MTPERPRISLAADRSPVDDPVMRTPLLRKGSVSDERFFFSYHTPPASYVGFLAIIGWVLTEDGYITAAVLGGIGVLLRALNPLVVRMSADRDGIRVSNWTSAGKFKWSEVAEIRLVPLRTRGHVIQVTSTDGEKVKAMAEVTGTLGGSRRLSYLQMSEVVDRLDAFRRAAETPPAVRDAPQVWNGPEPESWDDVRDRINDAMTLDQAAFVRWVRVNEDESWQRVSERFSAQFGHALYARDLSGNQMAGKYLCAAAARLLGQADSAPARN
jgi:hypothetical protein